MFDFKASNNEVEYEAVITWPNIVRNAGAKKALLSSDSN